MIKYIVIFMNITNIVCFPILIILTHLKNNKIFSIEIKNNLNIHHDFRSHLKNLYNYGPPSYCELFIRYLIII